MDKRKPTHMLMGRKSDARFCVMGYREFDPTKAYSPTSQLQIARAMLSVIAYRMRNFSAMGGVARISKVCAFRKSNSGETSIWRRGKSEHDLGTSETTLRDEYRAYRWGFWLFGIAGLRNADEWWLP